LPFAAVEESMMNLSARYSVLLGSVVIVGAVGALLNAQAPKPKPGFADPVLGRWDLTVQGAKGPYPSWLEISLRTDEQVHGRFVGEVGSVRYVSRIEFADGNLTFSVPVQYETNKTDLTFKGRLSGDRLQGTTQDAAGRTISWTGVRAPLLRRASPPKWGAPVELFNGRDMTGWKLRNTAHPSCWSMSAGTLTNAPPCSDIISTQTFTDFKLHVEFMYPAHSNSGIYLRGRYEVQIEDDAGQALDPERIGGVYGFLWPYENAALPPSQWQTYDITLVGRRVTVVLNGKTTLEDEGIPGPTGGALDSNEGTPGPLMLQGDHAKVSFRKVTLTPTE
jgi:Domain of Unknown Function (DUF1080)